MFSFRNFALACALVSSTAATSSFASSLVNNGDFQTGSLSGWTVSGDTSFPWTVAQDGDNFYATTGCVGDSCITGRNPSALYQDLTTIAGHDYTLTFTYASAGSPSELTALFGNALADDLIDASTSATTYTVSGLLAQGSTTRLEFLGRQDPNFNFLDNITVVDNGSDNSPVPEPGTVGLVGTGILGLIGGARRRLRA